MFLLAMLCDIFLSIYYSLINSTHHVFCIGLNYVYCSISNKRFHLTVLLYWNLLTGCVNMQPLDNFTMQ